MDGALVDGALLKAICSQEFQDAWKMLWPSGRERSRTRKLDRDQL